MQWAWLIPVFSFAVAPIIVIIGNRLPGKGALLSIPAIAAGFVLFWIAFFGWLDASTATEQCYTAIGTEALTCNYERVWFNAGLPGLEGSVALTLGFFVDPVTIAMLGLVTFVALMVQIYSLGYMHGDPRINWYFAVHALFAASMLTIILSDSFLLLYVAWELVGVCSYLLIGFWHERPAAREAAKKAFIVTRIGDVGLLVGILLLWREVGTFSMTDAFAAVQAGTMSEGVTIAAALLLFLGAMGKSAQIPFHVWLPDAMEGPTPVSALIHAATMVVAGVFLVARAFPLFEAYSGVPLMVVAIVGLVTALVTATIALVATDIKRILAYSTVSHLGLMMLSLGAGGYTAAIFHLLAHGFAKALLFLGSGSVIHSTEEQEISKLGGLRRVMPITTIVFAIGAASLGGIPILAGILEQGRDTSVGEQRTESGVYRVCADYGASERAVHGSRRVRDFLRQAAPRTGAYPRISAGDDRAADAAGGAGGRVRVHQLQLARDFRRVWLLRVQPQAPRVRVYLVDRDSLCGDGSRLLRACLPDLRATEAYRWSPHGRGSPRCCGWWRTSTTSMKSINGRLTGLYWYWPLSLDFSTAPSSTTLQSTARLTRCAGSASNCVCTLPGICTATRWR